MNPILFAIIPQTKDAFWRQGREGIRSERYSRRLGPMIQAANQIVGRKNVN
jgi:hypothetical protein